MSDVKAVTFFGNDKGKTGEPMYEAMYHAGLMLAERGITVMTGAYGGSGMEAPLRGAAFVPNECRLVPRIGFTHGGKPANEYVTDPINCDRWSGKIGWEASYGIRLTGLIQRADAFIVGADGGIGTLLEFIAALLFNEKFWKEGNRKRIAILGCKELRDGWEDRFPELLKWLDLHCFINNSDTYFFVKVVSCPENAVAWVLDGR